MVKSPLRARVEARRTGSAADPVPAKSPLKARVEACRTGSAADPVPAKSPLRTREEEAKRMARVTEHVAHIAPQRHTSPHRARAPLVYPCTSPLVSRIGRHTDKALQTSSHTTARTVLKSPFTSCVHHSGRVTSVCSAGGAGSDDTGFGSVGGCGPSLVAAGEKTLSDMGASFGGRRGDDENVEPVYAASTRSVTAGSRLVGDGQSSAILMVRSDKFPKTSPVDTASVWRVSYLLRCEGDFTVCPSCPLCPLHLVIFQYVLPLL
jgi:hypothetical protein